MKIAYLLGDTLLSGGIRVILAQADALADRGHDVTLVATEPRLTWRTSKAKWLQVDSVAELDAKAFDLVIGTFWTTVRAAWDLAGERAVHLCQGYEGAFSAYSELKSQIDDVYRLPIPKITVSRHLVDVCRQFSDDVTYIGQIVDDVFFQPRDRAANTPLRVLLSGQAEADMKGIDVGYEAVRLARETGAAFDLIRVSPWAPYTGEPVDRKSIV